MSTGSTSSSSNGGGLSITSLLGVAFVVLKLTHVINWSWWWVLLPFYGGLAFGLAMMVILGLVVAIFKPKPTRRW